MGRCKVARHLRATIFPLIFFFCSFCPFYKYSLWFQNSQLFQVFTVHIRRLQLGGGSHSRMGNEFFKWSLCVDPFPMMETMAFFKFECGTTNIEDWSWASLGGSTELICRAARQLTPGSFHKLWACCSHNWLPFLRAKPIGHTLSWASHKNGSMAFSSSHWMIEKWEREIFACLIVPIHVLHASFGAWECRPQIVLTTLWRLMVIVLWQHTCSWGIWFPDRH